MSVHLKLKILVIEVKKLVLRLVCQFKIRTLPFLFNFFELKERARIRRKINSQRKVFICDALRDLVSVTIWSLYDRSNACKCM